MQNLSNFSPSGAQGRNTGQISIEHLQRYITELTGYINENNHKYQKNMMTLKQFYQEQVSSLQDQRQQLLMETTRLNNDLITAKDLLANSNVRYQQLQTQFTQTSEMAQDYRLKLQRERKQIDQLYQKMTQIQLNCNKQLDSKNKEMVLLGQKNANLQIQVKQKNSQIKMLQQKMNSLESKIIQRYSLPEKIRDLQKDYDKTKLNLQECKRKCAYLQQKLDQTNLQLNKYRKQNESLRIMKEGYSAQKKIQMLKAQKMQREQAEDRIKKLQTQNQNYIYQLNQCQSRVKKNAKDINALQNQIRKQKQVIDHLQKKLTSTQNHKESYISEFNHLKAEYEAVIQRLEDSVIDYQKKNWNLEQQNNDLNAQLQSLQQLLRQIKAMNSLNPLKKQYRQLAELELIARDQSSNKNADYKNKADKSRIMESKRQNQKSELQDEWDKLMKDIQKIKV